MSNEHDLKLMAGSLAIDQDRAFGLGADIVLGLVAGIEPVEAAEHLDASAQPAAPKRDPKFKIEQSQPEQSIPLPKKVY